MKKAVINICLFLFSVIIALLLAEGIAQIYVYKIVKKGKLFEPDTITGWKVKRNINVIRKNADGNLWTIKTDKNGFREEINFVLLLTFFENFCS